MREGERLFHPMRYTCVYVYLCLCLCLYSVLCVHVYMCKFVCVHTLALHARPLPAFQCCMQA